MIYPFTERNKDISGTPGEGVVGGPGIVFVREAVVFETFFESLQAFANLLFGPMLVDDTPTRCVNTCQPV